MIFIDLENKLPTDEDLSDDVRWSNEEWEAWKAESERLVAELAKFTAEGKLKERNELIDDNDKHWKKLKPWLLELSNGKCWFSEAKELYSHYDVEHFRPKKGAKAIDGAERDGYWWLAFNYMNFRACGNVGNRKKGGWFPLREGSLCSTYAAQCEESETRYFLDPTNDADVSLVAFDEEGRVVPVPGATDWETERVVETVKRLKLNEHVDLAEERRKIWQKADRLIEKYLRTKARSGGGNNPAEHSKLNELSQQIRSLVSREAELSSVARWCILMRNVPQLSRLIG